jgi:hypothetical protein
MEACSGGDSRRPAVRVSSSCGKATEGEWERKDVLWSGAREVVQGIIVASSSSRETIAGGGAR